MRDRLIELLREAKEHPEKTCPRWELPTCTGCDYNKGDECDREARQADFLLENGVIVKPESGIGELSDGYHTFNELYHHRAILFSVICNSMPDKAWKSKLHDTGDMFEGMFIVGIETPNGQATYHYDIEPYWDMFKVKELEKAPEWDGHTPQDAIERIASVTSDERIHGRWIVKNEEAICSVCSCEALVDPKMIGKDFAIEELSDFCPHCGAVMDLKTGHSEEEWEKAVENIRFLRNEAKKILMGSFYVAQCDRMLREYEQGNRSDELFEEMMNAH